MYVTLTSAELGVTRTSLLQLLEAWNFALSFEAFFFFARQRDPSFAAVSPVRLVAGARTTSAEEGVTLSHPGAQRRSKKDRANAPSRCACPRSLPNHTAFNFPEVLWLVPQLSV